MGKKIFGFVFLVIVILGLLFGKMPETNLLNAVLPHQASILIKLADKYSSDVNVVFEGNDFFEAEMLKDDFLYDYGTDKLPHINFENLMSDYNSAKSNFISDKSRKLLLNKRYDTIFKQSREILCNPAAIIVSEPKDDPFMLFSDFIANLMQKEVRYYKDFAEKGYSVLNLQNVKQKSDIKKLFDLQKKYLGEGKNLYLTGSPIHSFYTSEHSAQEINIIVLLSSIFVLLLIYYYFGNIIIVIPIIISVFVGICVGYFLTAFIFHNVHVLTFVFSTSFIGICVDYSLHWFVENDKSKLLKSLTDSLVTTVAAFAVLLFANIPLLSQIAVFTSFGLISVYFFVKIFYSDFNFDFTVKNKFPLVKIRYKKLFLCGFVCFIVFGISKIHFADEITSLYKSPVELAVGEKILNNISIDTAKSFCVVSGDNLQHILEKEEEVKNLADAKFIALSDFVPSQKRQVENQQLTKILYDKKLSACSDLLSFSQRQRLSLGGVSRVILPDFVKNPILNKFMLDEKTSIMLVNKELQNNFNIDGVRVLNLTKDISSYLENHRKTCVRLVVCAFLLLFGYLYHQYGQHSFKIILPSIGGILTSFSLLGVMSQPVNLFHIFAMFLILGFTLDYSIFRIGKIKHSADTVFISCLTTSFSFFLLTFTSFKLISSLGLVLFVGIFSSYILSLLLIDGGENEMV